MNFRNLDSLTRWVKYMLYLQIIVAVISILFGSLEYELLSDYKNGVYTSQDKAVEDVEVNEQRQTIIGITDTVVFIISSFLILRWIHRANYNVRQLGAKNITFTPGWSIGYYFIPVLFFWKPYQGMKEIWKASKDPSDWKNQKTSGILPVWWILFLLSGFLEQMIFRLSMRADQLNELMNINIIIQITNVLNIHLALVFLAIVSSIHKMQTSQLEILKNPLILNTQSTD